jgi:hypothetical protein
MLLVMLLNLSKKMFLTPAIISIYFLTPLVPSVSALSGTQSGSISLTAIVLPARYIIINSNSTITEVITNTKELVTPTVSLNSISGAEESFSKSIKAQYLEILTSCLFNKNTGVIYATGKCTEDNQSTQKNHQNWLIDIVSVIRISSFRI